MSWVEIQRKIDGSAWVNKSLGLYVIESSAKEADGNSWKHVSLSRKSRLPTYEDMKIVKSKFIGDDIEAYQVFPAASDHVNIHEYCLHLWSRVDGKKALPDFTHGKGMI